MSDITIAPLEMPVTRKVVFSVTKVTAKETINHRFIWIRLTLKRSDFPDLEKVFEGLIDNCDGVLESLSLVARPTIEQMWKYPNLQYKFPTKPDGFAITSLSEVI